MMMRVGILALGTSILLGGCVPMNWPPHGGGGAAELAPAERARVIRVAATSTEISLLATLQAAEARLEGLKARGAARYAAAETVLATTLSSRIRRQIDGSLYSAAEADLIQLRDRLGIIEKTLSRPITSPMEKAT